ncbi:MAG: AraC family transcriptional regulator [Ruminococcaceae bacterium]|nr:AraC family transcriptional regulator [Oscillospiraceae bacterium]
MLIEDNRIFHFNVLYPERLKLDFIHVWQICETALPPGNEVEEHTQCCSEITYVVSGNGIISTNGTAFEVGPGDLHVVANRERHHIQALPDGNLHYICIGFLCKDIPEDPGGAFSFFDSSPDKLAAGGSDLHNLFEMLISEFYTPRETQSFAAEQLFKLILLKVHRAFMADSRKPKHRLPLSRSNAVYKIIKYIDDHIYTVKTIGEISEQLHYNESYISTVFKRSMGITLQTYIRQKKLEAAKLLLEHGKLTIAEVAELFCFDSVQSFGKIFKKQYGITPFQYIKQNRKDRSDDS